jgi:hypothetical protein
MNTLTEPPALQPGVRVRLTGGDRFHDDLTGVIADVLNDGRLIELILDGDTYPYRVTVEDYAHVEVIPNEVTYTGGETVPIPLAQRVSLDRVLARHGEPVRIAPEFFGKAIIVQFQFLTIGIEEDGYAHT